MKTLRASSALLALCLVCSVAWTQYQGPVRSSHERKAWADLPEQRSTTHPNNVPDPRELKRDADELAQLSQAISADFEAMSRGLVSSNLNERLKRIEKLSKRLRNAVESSSR